MKNITVLIDYATISPAVLANIIERNFAGMTYWADVNEDYFEFSVFCREADASSIEKKLAQYV